MLPVEEPAHVDGGRDGFDLLAEGAEGKTMDTLEDAALAPLNFVVFICCGLFEGSAYEEALHLHAEKGLEDRSWIEVQPGGEGGCGGGAEYL